MTANASPWLKGTISDRLLQTSPFFFLKPHITFKYSERPSLESLTHEKNSLGNSIFLERETILCSQELISGAEN